MSALHALIEAGRGLDAEYARGLSNHLPMALVALDALGADEACLQAFAASYSRRLRPAPPAQDWPAGAAWAGRLGEMAAWPAYRALFAQRLDHEGAAEVLAQVLPQLLPGVGAAAFHGLIRTAAAVRAGQPGELGDALAYWACRWLDLGASPTAGRVRNPAGPLARLPAGEARGGLIAERMRAAAALPGFDGVVGQLKVDAATLPLLARQAAALYARSGSFTALHLVTSAHALRLLLSFIPDPLPALRSYWRAYAAGVVAAAAVPGPPPAARAWVELVAAARAHSDEHVIKLVDACREEQQALGGGNDWQLAAARALADG